MSQEIQNRTRTFTAGGALAIYRRVRLSGGKLAYAGASDTDSVGITANPAFASGDKIAVTLCSAQGTMKMVAAGTFAAGVGLYAAAAGEVDDSGTVLIGLSLEAATAIGDIVEVIPVTSNTPATFARSVLTQDAAVPYSVPLTRLGVTATLAALGTAAGTPAGALGITAGSFGTNSPLLVGEAANANAKTDYARFLFTLPAEYDPGQAVTLRVAAKRTGALQVGGTVDASVYKSDNAGGIGADLCATNVQTVTAAFANYDFTITPTGLVPGDVLDVQLTVVADDTGGTNNKLVQIGAVQMLLAVKG
jgi:hypothetical protein